jgi:hypothetical protein
VVVIYYNVRTNYFTTSEVTDKTLSSWLSSSELRIEPDTW